MTPKDHLPATTWFTLKYDHETGLVAGLTLPEGAILVPYGIKNDPVTYYTEDPDTFWADSASAARVFNPLVGASIPGVVIDIPHGPAFPEAVKMGDVFYSFTTHDIGLVTRGLRRLETRIQRLCVV